MTLNSSHCTKVVIVTGIAVVLAFIFQINLQIFSILTNFYSTHGVGHKILKKKQVSVTFLLMRVSPKNMDEKQASITYFLVDKGGSQKYG